MRRSAYLLAAAAGLALLPASGYGQGGKKLTGVVGPGSMISLRSGAAKVRTLQPGTFTIVVRDRSAFHNFHLRGVGVNKKTGVAFQGQRTWKARLRVGKVYRYFCDVHASMNGRLNVRRAAASPAPPSPPAPPPVPPPTYEPYP